MSIFLLAASLSPDATGFIRNDLHVARYLSAAVDLNGDGRAELLVYATDPQECGSGGCDLYVLTRQGGSFRVVTTISIARPPVRVLTTTSHGWHDLSVRVAGGGVLPGYQARLRFDGRRYPDNPSVAPAVRLGRAAGRAVIE